MDKNICSSQSTSHPISWNNSMQNSSMISSSIFKILQISLLRILLRIMLMVEGLRKTVKAMVWILLTLTMMIKISINKLVNTWKASMIRVRTQTCGYHNFTQTCAKLVKLLQRMKKTLNRSKRKIMNSCNKLKRLNETSSHSEKTLLRWKIARII